VTSRFRYRAATARGELVEGVLEAPSRDALLNQLRSRDLHAVSVHEIAAAGAARRGGPGGRSALVARWARGFATLLEAGMPVERALRISVDQTAGTPFGEVLDTVLRSVQEGDNLSSALARQPRWFPGVVSAMAQAGEATGTLGEVFGHVADYLEEDAELRAQVRSALIYPALMGAVAAIGVAVLLLFVVPRFAVILDDLGGTLPLSTRILMFSGSFLGRWWWLLLGVGAAVALSGRAWLQEPSNRRALHGLRLSWPVVGPLEQSFITARFSRILGLLLSNGLPLLPALRIGKDSVENLAFAEGIEQSMASVAEGRSLAGSVRDFFPPLAAELLAVGEESGQLGTMCLRLAASYEKEVQRTVKVAVSLLEPAMIIIFGGLVGLVALAMLQAIYSVNANLS